MSFGRGEGERLVTLHTERAERCGYLWESISASRHMPRQNYSTLLSLFFSLSDKGILNVAQTFLHFKYHFIKLIENISVPKQNQGVGIARFILNLFNTCQH